MTLETNIESAISKVTKEFEEKPVATTIKGIIILWVLKEVIKWFKN